MTDRERELEWLREMFVSPARGARSEPGCPEPERLWRAVRGELPPAETRELVDHTAACPACAEDWRLAREIQSRSGSPIEEPRQAPRRRRIAWGVAAAAVLIGVAVLVPLWRPRPDGDSPPVVRAPDPGDRIRSLIPDQAALPRSRCTLRWSSELGPEVEYDILVATGGLDVLFSARDLEEPMVQVPVEALVRVPAGGTLLWQVVARLPGGRSVTSSTFVSRLE